MAAGTGDILKKYSIVIGANTKELTDELNRAERELKGKLDNIDLGAGIRESIEEALGEIKTLRKELSSSVEDINNSIQAINTDTLKGDFKNLQKIISGDISNLQDKIKGLTDSIKILDDTGLSNLSGNLDKVLSGVTEKMDTVISEFKTFNEFTQDLRVGAIDTSKLESSLKKGEKTIAKETEKIRKSLEDVLEQFDTDKAANIQLLGVNKENVADAMEYLKMVRNIADLVGQLDSSTIRDIELNFGFSLNEKTIKEQARDIRANITDFYNQMRGDVGKAPDIYLRWKTEINPGETADDIFDKIDKEYTEKIQKKIDDKPLKFKTEIPSKDFQTTITDAIKEQNDFLKGDGAPKLKIGVELDKDIDKDDIEELSKKLSNSASNINTNTVVNGGNININSDNMAQESTLSEIRDILSGWNGHGIPYFQSQEQKEENIKIDKLVSNAKDLIRTGKLKGSISNAEQSLYQTRLEYAQKVNYLNETKDAINKISGRGKGIKWLNANNQENLKSSDYYNKSFIGSDGVVYSLYGISNNKSIPLDQWQKQLEKDIAGATSDYFKLLKKNIEKRLKSTLETLAINGVEFDKNGKILDRTGTIFSGSDKYKQGYAKTKSLKDATLDGQDGEYGLRSEVELLDTLKHQRSLMQDINSLILKRDSNTISEDERELLESKKEELRLLTREVKDENIVTSLLKEQEELLDKKNKNQLDYDGYLRLSSIPLDIEKQYVDANNGDIEQYIKENISSIDDAIKSQESVIKKARSKFYKEFSRIKSDMFSDSEVTDDASYERILKEFKSNAKRLSILSQARSDKKDALLPSEEAEFWNLTKRNKKILPQLEAYREINEEVKEIDDKIISLETTQERANNSAKEYSDIYKKIGSDANKNITEKISELTDDELKSISKTLEKFVNKKDSSRNATDIVNSNIDERIKILESLIAEADKEISYRKDKNIDVSFWERIKQERINDLEILKSSKDRHGIENDIIQNIKIKNDLSDEEIQKVNEILDITSKINSLNQQMSKKENSQVYLDYEKNRNELEKSRQEIFDSLKISNTDSVYLSLATLLSSNITELISDSVIKGISDVDSNLGKLLQNKLQNMFASVSEKNILESLSSATSISQDSARIKSIIDEEIRKRSSIEKPATDKNIIQEKPSEQSNLPTIDDINKKYEGRIDNLQKLISEQEVVVDNLSDNLRNVKQIQDEANGKLKKYQKFNDYNTKIERLENLRSSKEALLITPNKIISQTKDRINTLTETLNNKSFSDTQTQESVELALENAKKELEIQELKLITLEGQVEFETKEINAQIDELIEQRSKSRTRYKVKSSPDELLKNIEEMYNSEIFSAKNYSDEVLKYMSAGGDFSKLPKNTFAIISSYIDTVKNTNELAVKQAQDIYDNEKVKLDNLKEDLKIIDNAKNTELNRIIESNNRKDVISSIEAQYKDSRGKTSITKGMNAEEKMASFKIDYQLKELTFLYKEQEKIKNSVGETSEEYINVADKIKKAKDLLSDFKKEAKDLGLTISNTTGRAYKDSSKKDVSLGDGIYTGFNLNRVKEEKERREELEKSARLNEQINRERINAVQANKELVESTKKENKEFDYYLGMTNEEKEIAKKLFEENKKLFALRSKNSKATKEEIDSQQEVVNEIKEQITQYDRLYLKKSRSGSYYAKLKDKYNPNTNTVNNSNTSYSSTAIATEGTLSEIRDILKSKLGAVNVSNTDPKNPNPNKKGKNQEFNFKGYFDTARALGIEVKKSKNGKEYLPKDTNKEKIYSEMEKLGIPKYVDKIKEATKETKKNTDAQKENTKEKQKETKEKGGNSKKTNSSYDKELYYKIAEEKGYRNKNGSVKKGKRNEVYLEMESRKPGSSGQSAEKLEQYRNELKGIVEEKKKDIAVTEETEKANKEGTQSLENKIEKIEENIALNKKVVDGLKSEREEAKKLELSQNLVDEVGLSELIWDDDGNDLSVKKIIDNIEQVIAKYTEYKELAISKGLPVIDFSELTSNRKTLNDAFDKAIEKQKELNNEQTQDHSPTVEKEIKATEVQTKAIEKETQKEKESNKEKEKSIRYTEEQIALAKELGLRITEKGTNIHKNDRAKLDNEIAFWNKSKETNSAFASENWSDVKKIVGVGKGNPYSRAKEYQEYRLEMEKMYNAIPENINIPNSFDNILERVANGSIKAKDGIEELKNAIDSLNKSPILSDTTTAPLIEEQNELQKELKETREEAEKTSNAIKDALAYRGTNGANPVSYSKEMSGTFWTTNKNVARQHGADTDDKTLFSSLVNIENPMVVDALGATVDKILYVGDASDDTSKEITELSKKEQELREKLTDTNTKMEEQVAIAMELQKVCSRIIEISKDPSNEYGYYHASQLSNLSEKKGYDGLHIKNVNYSVGNNPPELQDFYVTTQEQQLKNIELLAVANKELAESERQVSLARLMGIEQSNKTNISSNEYKLSTPISDGEKSITTLKELSEAYGDILNKNNMLWTLVNCGFEQLKSDAEAASIELYELEEVMEKIGVTNAVKDNKHGLVPTSDFVNDDIKNFSTYNIQKYSEKDVTYIKGLSKEILQSYVDGAKADTAELKEVFTKLANIPIEVIKTVLSINSPSKTMEKLGFWTVAGFKEGLEKNFVTIDNVMYKFSDDIVSDAEKIQERIKDAILKGTISQKEYEELLPYLNRKELSRKQYSKNIKSVLGNIDYSSIVKDNRDIVSQIGKRETYKYMKKEKNGTFSEHIGGEYTFVERLQDGQFQNVLVKYDEKTGKWEESVLSLNTAFEKVGKEIIKLDTEINTLTNKMNDMSKKHPGYDVSGDIERIQYLDEQRKALYSTLSIYHEQEEYEYRINTFEQERLANQQKLNSINKINQNVENIKEREHEFESLVGIVKEYYNLHTQLNNLKAQDKGIGTKTAEIKDLENIISELKPTADIATDSIRELFSQDPEHFPIENLKELIALFEMIDNMEVGSSKSKAKETDAIRNMSERYTKNLEKRFTGYNNIFNGFGRDFEGGGQFQEYSALLDKLRKDLEKLKEYKGVLKDQITKDDITTIEEYERNIKQTIADIENIPKAQRGFTKADIHSYLERINIQLKENSAMSRTAKNQIKAYYEEIRSGNPTRPLEEIYNSVMEIVQAERAAGREGKSFFAAMKDKAFYGMAQQLSMYFGLHDIIRYIREGITTVQELDTALTEMRKVSDESVSSLKNFQKTSFDVAQQIGVTALEIQNSAADFMRLGYSLEDASKLAEDANIYANVGDMDISEATEHMISSIQAWQSEFSNATEASTNIIDRYNEVGNKFAITSADIGSAMERSAAALKAGGNDLNESIGLIVAGNLIQQDADTTANALKVMSLRIRGAKADLSEMGEETDDLVDSTSKMREEIKALTGVDIMLDENTFKSTADIISEIGAVWDKLSDVSQAAALEKLAGELICLKFMETYFYRTHLIALIA